MTWCALNWACRRGCEVFDFGGANTPSIATFKASFGACEALYIKKPHGVLASAAAFFADTVLRPCRAQYVLEVAAGELLRASVAVGSLAEFSDSIPNPRAAEPWP